jgi:hypothetical protein
MATLQQIENALRKADAAGNVADARRLAAAYRAAQGGSTAYQDALAAGSQASTVFADYQPQPADAPRTVSGPSKNIQSTGMLQNITAGIDSNVNVLLGAPVDFPVWVGNSLINATNSAVEMAGAGRPIPNIPTDLPGSREGWERTQGRLGFTTPDQIASANTAERLARAAGEAVGGAVIPELFAVKAIQQAQQLGTAAAPLVRQTADVARNLLGAGDDAGRFAANMAINASAGAGAQAAADAAPEGWEMPAALAGGLIAGTPVAIATSSPAAARIAGNVAGDFIAPMTQAGRERLAGQTLAENATDLSAVRDALDNPLPPRVDGSQPTTFQATGDMGLGGLERAVSTRNPADFMQRRTDQNAARVFALENIQPGGAPEQVAASVRTLVNAIDNETQAALDAVTTRGNQAVADVAAKGDASVTAATKAAQDEASALGVGRTPEVVGEDLRAALETSRAQAKESERALWKAVDPDGSLALPVSTTKAQVQAIQRELTPLSAKPEGVEAAIYADLAKIGDEAQPFAAITALDSRVKEALRAERLANGESTAYRRLSQLKSAIEADLDAAVAGKVAQERQAVQTGQMSFEQTIEANLLRQRDEWANARTQGTTGLAGEAGSSLNGRGGTAALPGARGTAGEASGGLRPTQGDPGLSANAGGDTARPAITTSASVDAIERAKLQPDFGPSYATVTTANGTVIRLKVLRVGGETVEIMGADPSQGFMPMRSRPGDAMRSENPVDILRRRFGPNAEIRLDLPDPPRSGGGTIENSGGANFDQAALDRLREARGATRERVATFDNSTLAPIRRRPATTSPYTMGPAAVPQRIFFPGAKSADAIATYRRAVGDEQAMSVLSDYIVDRLRKHAMRADGTLDPVKVAGFQRSHADALRAFPELNARFGGAANASSKIPLEEAAKSSAVKQATKAAEDAIAAQAAQRKQQLDAAQKGALGRLMGVDDPADVVRVVGGIFSRQDAVNEMGRLRSAIGDNKQAQEGLRKSIVDFVSDRFISNTAAGTSDQNLIKADGFQTFVKRNQNALAVAGFKADEIKVLQDISDDLRQANQSISAVRLPGASNTAQDVFAAKIGDTPSSLLTKIIGAGAASGGLSTLALGPILGIPVGVATSLVTAMRQAGLEQIDDIVKDAMLNPDRARLLLQKVKPRDQEQIGHILAQQYRRIAVVSAALGEGGQ